MSGVTIENDWHEWRKAGIGSSDAPIIVGVSPYFTPHDLWEFKTGRKKAWSGNWATRRGHSLEPKARATYELMYDIDMPPILVQHPNFTWLRASLDGYNKQAQTILEIKCPGRNDHDIAKQGKVPNHYFPQLQHQLLVTGAQKVHYWSFDGSKGVLVEVMPDYCYLKDYFLKSIQFWEYVQADQPPPFVDRDWKLVRSKLLKADLEEWYEASFKDKQLADAILQRIFEAEQVKSRRVRCDGFLLDGVSKTISSRSV